MLALFSGELTSGGSEFDAADLSFAFALSASSAETPDAVPGVVADEDFTSEACSGAGESFPMPTCSIVTQEARCIDMRFRLRRGLRRGLRLPATMAPAAAKIVVIANELPVE